MSNIRKRVLVVDDNQDAAELLGELLTAEEPTRFTVEIALNGQLALDAAMLHVPDTVVMDIEMPVMDGIVAALEFRRRPETASAHLIAVTGRNDYVEKVRRQETGFHHGILKPIDFDKLISLIDTGTSAI